MFRGLSPQHAVLLFALSSTRTAVAEMTAPPGYSPLKSDADSSFTPSITPRRRPLADRTALAAIVSLALIAPFTLVAYPSILGKSTTTAKTVPSPLVAQAFGESLATCNRLHTLPGPPKKFGERTKSDRYVEGTPSVLIRNATIWTGEDNGHEVLHGDILLANGIIKSVGSIVDINSLPANAVIHQAHGAFHSHIGVDAAPSLSGASDTNSVQKPVLPYLRSLDGINTHDLAYKRSISGGVTTALVLPGSANNIGGQAFVIKLRATKEKTPDSLVLEMPYHIPTPNKTVWDPEDPPRWRHMKMACGENIRRVYKQTRLDLSYNFRSALEKARSIKISQDEYCEKAVQASARGDILEEKFPYDLEWEALVDVLRGKVKVNTHCYESTDFSAFIRHTNEFQFPVAAFHHAHEAYIVPDLLKTAWNSTPAVAIFATNARYKREAWRGSEYAAKILSENNITVIMKSDHPVLDSRFLLFEAQQAHHFGLPENLALASIITLSAKTAGFGHRLGLVRPGFDSDLVLWDSHPLTLGATPLQVFIDGIAQLHDPFTAKPLSTAALAPAMASMPESPLTLQDDDDSLPTEVQAKFIDEVFFTNVSEVMVKSSTGSGLEALAGTGTGEGPFSVHIRAGEVICAGQCSSASSHGKEVNLLGGSLLPPLIGFGPALGLVDIISESSTKDAAVYDALLDGDLSQTQQLWGPTVAVRAIDGLGFGGKHLKVAHQAGVTKAVTAPLGDGFFRGVSVAFRTNAANILDSHAILKDVVALHVTVGHFKLTQRASISTQIAELRGLLLGTTSTDTSTSTTPDYFRMAGRGEIPLVINAWKADTIATIILLKREVEKHSKKPLKWIIHGGQESHLVANELADAKISVILSPPRAFPASWDERRAVPGPPMTQRSAVNILHNAGVLVGLGVPEEWMARLLLWEAAWASRDSNAEISRRDAVAWLTSNLETILDLPAPHKRTEFVAYERDPFEFGSRPVAASSGDGQSIELFE
ncbi:hypothetical protein P7C70_g1364, partial [Phenoliferia sp. Uapishka_3]